MLNANLEFGFDLDVKGFVNIDGINSTLDLHVTNEHELQNNHLSIFNTMKKRIEDAKKQGAKVSYDLKIKGHLTIVGIQLEIEKEFKSEDINKA